MTWKLEAEKRQESMLKELQELIAIPSILSDDATPDAPFGKEVKRALDWFLTKGREKGYQVKNIDNKAGHLEIGEGEELLGILGHVDVVPVGEGWTKDPFGGIIEGGKLFGRGAIDDKGPTIAAWTALNMVKDAGYEFDKRIRLIIGTDEESGFRCVENYFQKEEMPTMAFAPDADFPIINAEKGIADLVFSQVYSGKVDQLVSFKSGDRTNMVPDSAEAIVEGSLTDWKTDFETFSKKLDLHTSIDEESGLIQLTVSGKAAHAMEPNDGINAGVMLAEFLKNHLTGNGQVFTDFIADKFYEDTRGKSFGLEFSDEVSGETTFNAGIMRFDKAEGGKIEVSMRYSISYAFDEKMVDFQVEGFSLNIIANSKPHYVDANDPFILTLQDAFEKETGEKAELMSIGGGTYARVMDKGVAFGMLFPGERDVAHQLDEFVDIANMTKAVAIYAEAICQLACIKK